MAGSDDPLLAGVTVLDFTRVLAGPYCTRLLSDLGARVIKIERPGEGDDTRRGHAQIEPGRTDQGTYFIRINAGKSSLALDLVYCSISGFGQSGPLRLQPAFHHIVNAMSGIMYLEQQTDPAPRPGYLQAADVLAGTHAFGAILAALWRRARTGRGAYLDVSMLECMVGAEDINYGGMLNAGAEYPGPRPGMIVHGVGGRHVAMQTVGAPQLWPRLVAMMNRPDLETDPRFATPAGRREHWGELAPIICKWLDRFATVEDAVKTLTAARVPASVVLSPAEVVAHPHLKERQAFPEIDHPGRGTVRITAVPFHVDSRPVKPQGGAPYRVGEHTRAVLGEILGYSRERIEELARLGTIGVV